MNINFNGNGFEAKIDNNKRQEKITKTAGDFLSFVFSIISVLLAFLLIPTGVFASIGTTALAEFFEIESYNYIVAYSFGIIILTLLSVASSIISMVLYSKSRKSRLDTAALIIAICSIVIACVGMVYNMLVMGVI